MGMEGGGEVGKSLAVWAMGWSAEDGGSMGWEFGWEWRRWLRMLGCGTGRQVSLVGGRVGELADG